MNRLVEYADSEGSDDENADPLDKSSEKVLAVPDSLKAGESSADIANKDLHQGRIRSFEHERGNWASYVYVAVPHIDEFEELAESLVEILNSFTNKHKFCKMDSPHISLTRTLKLRHHWLKDMTRSLEELSSVYSRFYISLRDVNIYTNDEETRTFISIKVASGDDQLLSIVHRLNDLLAQYNLPPFYKEASFHVSLCWCVHNARSDITSSLKSQLQDCVDEWVKDNTTCSFFQVSHLVWKSGNKESLLPLAAN